jgi:hypothetical protein
MEFLRHRPLPLFQAQQVLQQPLSLIRYQESEPSLFRNKKIGEKEEAKGVDRPFSVIGIGLGEEDNRGPYRHHTDREPTKSLAGLYPHCAHGE